MCIVTAVELDIGMCILAKYEKKCHTQLYAFPVTTPKVNHTKHIFNVIQPLKCLDCKQRETGSTVVFCSSSFIATIQWNRRNSMTSISKGLYLMHAKNHTMWHFNRPFSRAFFLLGFIVVARIRRKQKMFLRLPSRHNYSYGVTQKKNA